MSAGPRSSVGAVAIGKNEGERLRICLHSLAEQVAHVVYVDSGSSDGSVELARSMGAEVVELCVRLRQDGWKIRRMDAEMALHDVAMSRFSQWTKRAMRAGHAYAEGSQLHSAPPERMGVRESRRIVAWGLIRVRKPIPAPWHWRQMGAKDPRDNVLPLPSKG